MNDVIKLRLFCLPYSGASAMAYSRWRRSLPEWLQVRPLELLDGVQGLRMDGQPVLCHDFSMMSAALPAC